VNGYIYCPLKCCKFSMLYSYKSCFAGWGQSITSLFFSCIVMLSTWFNLILFFIFWVSYYALIKSIFSIIDHFIVLIRILFIISFASLSKLLSSPYLFLFFQIFVIKIIVWVKRRNHIICIIIILKIIYLILSYNNVFLHGKV